MNTNSVDQTDTVKEYAPEVWAEMLVNNHGHRTVEQEAFFNRHFKAVNRLIKPFLHYEESSQISFLLTLIDYSYNKVQIQDLANLLTPLMMQIKPVRVHKDVTDQFITVPIMDKGKGENGSYSLIGRITDGQLETAIYCESKTRPYRETDWQTLEKSLTYAAKRLFYFG